MRVLEPQGENENGHLYRRNQPSTTNASQELTEYEGIAATFATAKVERSKRLTAGRSLERNMQIESSNFKTSHGLLVLLLLVFFYLHAVGIFLFTKGFLLTRMELEHKSSCEASPLIENEGLDTASAQPDGDNGCWHPKSFSKAVVVIIDALRYDFTVPFVPKGDTDKLHHFHNMFTTPHRIATTHPENAFLLPFIADPPTTTLQRLKGLTTGTLPTFVDAGSNFAGNAISEDNLISQLKSMGKRMAFMGDDTWMALFPGLFEQDMVHPYDSLNVWDLHTVDNGINDHIFPLLHPENSTRWDVLFAHYLGVDHAGHRYGPDHSAMSEKLQQMDQIVQRLIDDIDHDTLLIIMGDHGMDPKGDHGGESQGEVEAALWMYSKDPVFGRLPSNLLSENEVRSVAQIDLVPTLSLLLGIPVPFNNLGAPIAEAFLGKTNGMQNLAQVMKLTAAQIKRYQQEYTQTNHDDLDNDSIIKHSWLSGQQRLADIQHKPKIMTEEEWAAIYGDFNIFQRETLRICKYLWTQFDLVSMVAGVVVLLGSIPILAVYSRGFVGDKIDLTDTLLRRMLNGLTIGIALSLPVAFFTSRKLEIPMLHTVLFSTAVGVIIGFLSASVYARRRLSSVLPRSSWGLLSFLFVILNAALFGSNSFTIWEDKVLTYMIATFAIGGIIASQRHKNSLSRALGTYHSVMLLLLTRFASFSQLCREEQMPYCTSTFYASATSSVSAPWTLALLFMMAFVLPSIIKSYYHGTRSYEGPAPVYIGWAFRLGIILVAVFWTLDSADNGSWFPSTYDVLIKGTKKTVAQTVLAMSLVAGNVGFGWSSLCLGITVEEKDQASTPKEEGTELLSTSKRSVALFGYANVHGSRYFLLVLSWALAIILLQKPMGGLSVGILLWQILSLLEIVDVNDLSTSSIGPVVLALLGNAHFFSTGHQATIASIQWESAFIPLSTIRYPWSPLLVVGNTLGAPILAALAVPLIALWKAPPKRSVGDKEGLLSKVAKAATTFMLFQTTITTASVVCAGWLRRHLMLYRVFCPRFMLGAVTLLVVELVCIVLGVGALRWNWSAVGDIFGYF